MTLEVQSYRFLAQTKEIELRQAFCLFILTFAGIQTHALEVQGFLTRDCQKHIGVTVYVDDDQVELINLQGVLEKVPRDSISTLSVFDVIENPIENFHIDQAARLRLKAVYLEDSPDAGSLAFPVRFIEDLVIFYSLSGQTHVHTLADIYKLRPPPDAALGDHLPKTFKKIKFELIDPSEQCPSEGVSTGSASVKPTRMLADKISVSEFLHSFQQGYEAVESFQERTYLYAKPFLFERHPRLGINFQGSHDEPAIPLPLYFQWSTGDPYRFQSSSVVGSKRMEIVPNAEPVAVLRSDVKSHIFHGVFIGNIAGIPAGNSIFIKNSFTKLTDSMTVQPSFNYLAMMGGDYGPYTLSVGLFHPSYGIKVNHEFREILASQVSYAVRLMYTRNHLRLRAIGSATSYSSGSPSQNDVLSRSGDDPDAHPLYAPNSYEFSSIFIRGGLDYDYSDHFSVGVDGIVVNGNYKESTTDPETSISYNNNIRFNRLTIQPYLRQSFGEYVSLTGYVDLIQNNFKATFVNQPSSRQQQESDFFGTLEFIF